MYRRILRPSEMYESKPHRHGPVHPALNIRKYIRFDQLYSNKDHKKVDNDRVVSLFYLKLGKYRLT
jgi:hypothetical protein